MINIKVGNLMITSDSSQYTVSVVKTYNTGKHIGQEFTKVLGYFSNYESLKEGLKEILTKRSNATTLTELLTDRSDIERQVDTLFTSKEASND